MSRTFEKQRAEKRICERWLDKGSLKTAVLVDVDGVLAGPYRKGQRQLRPTALFAIEMLSEYAPVFLWSVITGNAERLIAEFPELSTYVTGCYEKKDFPFHLVEDPYCIDDELVDSQVLECNHVIADTYYAGPDSGLLLEAVKIIIDRISQAKE